jgi:hypothetical protein
MAQPHPFRRGATHPRSWTGSGHLVSRLQRGQYHNQLLQVATNGTCKSWLCERKEATHPLCRRHRSRPTQIERVYMSTLPEERLRRRKKHFSDFPFIQGILSALLSSSRAPMAQWHYNLGGALHAYDEHASAELEEAFSSGAAEVITPPYPRVPPPPPPFCRRAFTTQRTPTPTHPVPATFAPHSS